MGGAHCNLLSFNKVGCVSLIVDAPFDVASAAVHSGSPGEQEHIEAVLLPADPAELLEVAVHGRN